MRSAVFSSERKVESMKFRKRVFMLLTMMFLLLIAGSACASAIKLPPALSVIESESFKDDTSITSVYFPKGVTRIEPDAFSGCVSITDVYFDGTLNEWDQIEKGSGNESILAAKLHCLLAKGTWGTCQWELNPDGVLTVHSGKGEDTSGHENDSPWKEFRNSISSIVMDEKIEFPEDCSSLFYDLNRCRRISLKGVDTYNMINMWYMFSGCTELEELDLRTFNTGNVRSMLFAFSGCKKMTSINVSSFDTSNVVDLGGLFCSCSSLKQLDLSNFVTTKATSFESMFQNCISLQRLDLSGFDTSQAGNMRMKDMFENCCSLSLVKLGNRFSFRGNTESILTELPDANWYSENDKVFYTADEIANQRNNIADTYTTEVPATLAEGIWGTCAWVLNNEGVLSIGKGTGVDTSGTCPWQNIVGKVKKVVAAENIILPADSSRLFDGFSFCQDMNLSGMNTGAVTKMNEMFRFCSALSSLDASHFDSSHVVNMSGMFAGCTNLKDLNIENFNTENTTDMGGMFSSCESLEKLNISHFNTSKVTNMASMFFDCSALTDLEIGNLNTSAVTNMAGMFSSCGKLKTVDVSGFDTKRVSSMNSMFWNCYALNHLDTSMFDTSNVTDMESMFANCRSLTFLDTSRFNTQSVRTFRDMFGGCSALTELDVSGFDTSGATDMRGMFSGCESLRSLDVSGFNTSSVTDMSQMFKGCSQLTVIDVSSFNVRNVTYFNWMFASCSNVENLDISGFSAAEIDDFMCVFWDCKKIKTLDLSGLNTSGASSCVGVFDGCDSLEVVTVGENFTFVGRNSGTAYLPDKPWFADSDGKEYTAQEITANRCFIADTYRTDGSGSEPGPREGLWGTCAWEISEDGVLTIHGGTGIDTNGVSPWAASASVITSVVVSFGETVILPPDASCLFDGFRNCTSLEVRYLDTSNVTNMHAMFRGCNGTHWGMNYDTSNVMDMSSMFENCKSLEYQAFYKFSNPNLKDTSRMFAGCENMTSIANPDHLLVSSLENASGMFMNCKALQTIDFTNCDISGVKSISGFFKNCEGLKTLDIAPLDFSSVTNAGSLFEGCISLMRLDLSKFNSENAEIMSDMFNNCHSLSSVTIGEKFSFKGASHEILARLPDRNWCSTNGQYYTAEQIAGERNNILDTYNAYGEDDGFYYRFDDSVYCTILGYYGESLNLVIPSQSPDGHIVRAIEKNAFAGRNDLTGTLRFPDALESIGENAFKGCSGLTGSLEFSGNLKEIGSSAFSACTGLSGNLTIPGHIVFGESVFADCTGINGSLIIESGVTIIPANMFCRCNFTGDLYIPDSVTRIEKEAFKRCTFSGSLTLSERLTTIEEGCFASSHFSGDLVIPDSVLTISKDAFNSAYFPGRLVLSANLTEIAPCGFLKGDYTGELILPDTLRSIGASAFGGCYNLYGQLFIPDSVTSLGIGAFVDCWSFSSIRLSNNLVTIPSSAFERCVSISGDLEIPEGVTEIGSNAFAYCFEINGKLILPDSLTKIGDNAFYYDYHLSGPLKLPPHLSSLGNAAFSRSGVLRNEIYIPESVDNIKGKPFTGSGSYNMVLVYRPNTHEIANWAGSLKPVGFQLEEDSYAHTHAEEHELTPYILIPKLRVAIMIWPENKIEIGDYLSLVAISQGGIWPFEYRYEFTLNGNSIVNTDWMPDWDAYTFIPPETGYYTAKIYIKDSTGKTAESGTAFGVIIDLSEERQHDKEMVESMLSIMNNVKAPQFLHSMQYYESSNDTGSRLIHSLMTAFKDIATLDFADMAETYSGYDKYKFLFDKAISASASGNIGTFIVDLGDAIPTVLKSVKTASSGVVSDYYRMFYNLCDPDQIGGKVSEVEEIFKNYLDGKSDDYSRTALINAGITDEGFNSIYNSMKSVKMFYKISKIAGGFKDLLTKVDSALEIYNQYVLLESLDLNQLRRFADTYSASSNIVEQEVGKTLYDFINADEAGRVAMIAAGKFIEMGLDDLTKGLLSKLQVKVSGTAGKQSIKGSAVSVGVTIVYLGINLTTNVDAYLSNYYNLQYAGSAVNKLWDSFTMSRNVYEIHPTDSSFTTMFYDLINYYSMVIEAEDCFVKLITKCDEAVLTTYAVYDFSRQAASEANLNRNNLTDTVATLKTLFYYWQAGDYEHFMAELKKSVETTRYPGGGGW